MRLFFRVFAIALIGAIFSTAFSAPAQADDLSAGCRKVSHDSLLNTPLPQNMAVEFDDSFKEGEIVIVKVEQISPPTSFVTFFAPALGTVYARGNAPITFKYRIPADGDYDLVLEHSAGTNGVVQTTWSCGVDAPPEILDGRVNSSDLAAPAVIYPSDTQLDIYAVNPDTSQGTLALRVPLDDLPPLDQPLDTPLLLARTTDPFTGQTIALYLLPTEEFQINAVNRDGSPYVFIWKR